MPIELQAVIITSALTLIGVIATIVTTAFIAIRQLRNEREQRTADRQLETKRELLIDGVRAMLQAQSSYMALLSFPNDRQEASADYRDAMERLTVASCVANIEAVRAGKEFSDFLGPLFLEAVFDSVELEVHFSDGGFEFEEKRIQLAEKVTGNIPAISTKLFKAISQVRTDIGLAEEPEPDFLKAVTPDLQAADKLTRKALVEARRWAGLSPDLSQGTDD